MEYFSLREGECFLYRAFQMTHVTPNCFDFEGGGFPLIRFIRILNLIVSVEETVTDIMTLLLVVCPYFHVNQ